MRYSIETTENGVNETLEVDGNLYKKEWEREENGLFRCKQKNFADQMENDGYDNESLLEKIDDQVDRVFHRFYKFFPAIDITGIVDFTHSDKDVRDI